MPTIPFGFISYLRVEVAVFSPKYIAKKGYSNAQHI